MSAAGVERIREAVESGGDADDVLRAACRILAELPRVAWAGIAFVEDGSLVLGPEAGTADESRRRRVAVAFQGETVAELWVDGDPDTAVLEAVAELIAPECLVGWDTGGAPWEP